MVTRLGALLAAGIVAAQPAAGRVHGAAWRVVDLGFGGTSYATSINASGQIVGVAQRRDGQHALLWENGRIIDLGPASTALLNDRGDVAIEDGRGVHLWRNGTTTAIGSLGPYSTTLAGINKHDVVIGWSANKAQRPHAFVWRDGTLRDVGGHGLAVSAAVDVNAGDQVVGWRKPRSRAAATQSRALLWQGGRTTDLGVVGGHGGSTAAAINDLGHVVGTSTTRLPAEQHGFIWVSGTLTDLGNLGSTRSVRPLDINRDDVVVGDASTRDGKSAHAFLWSGGRMSDLGTLRGDHWSSARAVNAQGLVIGMSVDDYAASAVSLGLTKAVVWENGAASRLPSLGKSESDTAFAIDDRGRIVGDSNGRAVLWTRGR